MHQDSLLGRPIPRRVRIPLSRSAAVASHAEPRSRLLPQTPDWKRAVCGAFDPESFLGGRIPLRPPAERGESSGDSSPPVASPPPPPTQVRPSGAHYRNPTPPLLPVPSPQ